MNRESYLINQYTAVFIALFALALFLVPLFSADAAVIRRAPNNLGLVGYWSFDDARGSIATDFSGNGNAGTLTNMDPGSDWVSGKRGSALAFDGSDDYVGTSPFSTPDNDVTFSAWFKLENSEINSSKRLVIGDSAWNNNNGGNGIQVYVDTSDDKLQWRLGDKNPQNQWGWEPKPGWYHIVGVADASNLSSNLYLNGKSLGVKSIDEAPGSASPFNIGARTDLGSQRWSGKLDEVRIYDRALSASEVKDLYNSGGYAKRNATADALYPDKLVSHWSMDGPDVSGSTVKDVFGSNDGTLDGSPYRIDSGVLGQSYEFLKGDNTGAPIIDLGDIFDFTGSDSFAIGAWVRPTGTGSSGNHTVISKYPGSSPYYRIQVGQSSGDLNVELKDSQGDSVTLSEAAAVPQNTWKYLMAVIDRSTDTAYAYINGEQVDSADISSVGSFASGASVSIAGNQFNQYGTYGNIDDVRIYDAALSADEVSRLYTATKPDTINSSQNQKLTDGLVGMWSFDGADIDWSSNTAEGVSENSNDGTIKNTSAAESQTPGKIGQALEFDGSDDYVDIDIAQMPQGAGSYSVSGWFKTTTTQNAGTIIMWGTGDKNNSTGIGLNDDGTNEQAQFILWDSDLKVSQSYSDGEWHHMVGVHDNASGEIKIFFDGNEIGSATENPDIESNFAAIGTNDYIPGGPVNHMDGKIDNIRIYDRALSADEIKRLYRLGR